MLYLKKLLGCTFILPSPVVLALNLVSIPELTNNPPYLPPANTTISIPAPATHDFSYLTSNLSLKARNADPVCNGSLLGVDLDRSSCLQAWATIPTVRQRVGFGDRSDGRFEVPLPRRFSGRKYTIFFWHLVVKQYICSQIEYG